MFNMVLQFLFRQAVLANVRGVGEPSLSTVFHYDGNGYYGRDLGRAVCEAGGSS